MLFSIQFRKWPFMSWEAPKFENLSQPFDEERFNYFFVLILPLKYDLKVLEIEMTFLS